MLKEEIIAQARALGFAECRFAAAAAPRHAAEFRQWLADGRAGEMAWLGRNAERRTNPELVQPGVRTIIVLAMNYWQGGQEENARAGQIARYAWGDDYHEMIEEKLKTLDLFLQARGGTQRRYVDTGPVLERDHAAVAGLGWHGKSTMLISRQLGAWFFLAEILTTLKIAPDEPARDHCGSCSRCISACPTGAITAPRQLDARRCVSYLTIEHRGPIPLEFRPLMGDRIYGCDDCLAACPWNRFAQASSEAAFAARPFVHGMALRDYLALDEEAFRALFRGSPIKRIKRARLLRNVCVALGNVGTPGDLPALERAAADAEPLIAEHARWAVAQVRLRNPACSPAPSHSKLPASP